MSLLRLHVLLLAMAAVLMPLSSPFGGPLPALRAPAVAEAAGAPIAPGFFPEREPNDQLATATLLPSGNLVVAGALTVAGDADVFAFAALAGDRVYAATMTSGSTSQLDTRLDLLDGAGTTLESDNDDGVLASTSSSIAGAQILSDGTYYLRVTGNGNALVRPYHLNLRLERGAPTPESEPNSAPQPLGADAWISGAIDTAGDTDNFAIPLAAGDTLYASLDLDPERDGIAWNGRLLVGPFGGFLLSFNDAATASPNSEALLISAREAGTYTLRVDSPAATANADQTYHLSVGVRPARPASCLVYTSDEVPLAIGPGASAVTSTMRLGERPPIGDLKVSIELTHSLMADVDATLTAPDGTLVGLFTDIGTSSPDQNGLTTLHVTLDDEAAFPIGSFSVVNGLALQPESAHRLSWLRGKQATGNWALTLYDDTANASGGGLLNWSLTICDPPPPAECPLGTGRVVAYSSDFEAGDGGFSSEGTSSQWQWGTPAAAPITASNSGALAWKTNLTGSYTNSADMILRSPPIDLGGLAGPVEIGWAHKYQLESATYDRYTVDVELVGAPPLSQTLFQHLDGTMTMAVGNPSQTLAQSAGWGEQRHALGPQFDGQSLRLRFRLSSDDSNSYAGVAVDDVTVTACQILPASATILEAAPNPASFGEPVILTATVVAASGQPTGTVAFFQNGSPLGLAPLDGGQASVILDALPAGSHEISATYQGSPLHGSSSAPVLTLSVSPASTIVQLNSSANPAPLGQPVTLTATVVASGGEPTGTVAFFEDGVNIGSASLEDGVAVISLSNLPVGAAVVTAIYQGSADHAPSSSLPLRQVVGPAGIAPQLYLPIVLLR
jgi:subtilisin-like proprotein convertase family protein